MFESIFYNENPPDFQDSVPFSENNKLHSENWIHELQSNSGNWRFPKKNREEKHMKRTICITVIIALTIIGCGKKPEEKIAEKIVENGIGKKANVDINDESVKIETEDGSMSLKAGKSAEVPKGFPSDVYIFKPANVEMAMEVGQGYSIALKTGKDIESVTSTYKKEMVKKGWERKAAMDMGENTMMMYEKEKRVTNIVVSQEDGETKIVLTVAKK